MSQMMKQIALVSFALTLTSHQVHAQLDELIKQNIRGARDSYEETLHVGEEESTSPRLWLHVRSDDQMQVAQEILNSLTDHDPGMISVKPLPVQKVDIGPDESQLRYFKDVDEEQVQQLLGQLKQLIPDLVLRDLSDDFANVGWIKPGHYELWLSPDLQHVTPSE